MLLSINVIDTESMHLRNATCHPTSSAWSRPSLPPRALNDPNLRETEGSEGKHSCGAGVEAELLSLPLTMHERVIMMSVDDREVLHGIMPV